MLRKRLLFPIFLLSLIVTCLRFSPSGLTTLTLRRITNTGEEALNLNPSISGDGRFIAFESSADLANAGSQGFHALKVDLNAELVGFAELGTTRSVTPAISQDGSYVAFASNDNPLGTNADGNSEIFLYRNSALSQVTNTTATDPAVRTVEGNFQPSISDDGHFIAFSSNRDLTGQNNNHNLEIYLFDATTDHFQQVTNFAAGAVAKSAKISGNGNVIAFIRDSQGSSELMLQSRLNSQLSRVVARGSSLALGYGRVISDDGLRVAYSATVGADGTEVFLWDGRLELTRQLTQLEPREADVPLHASLSGDGLRVSFATRRNVLGGNADHSVELYLLDLPSGQIQMITNAPSNATAEVVSSLNDDGSLVVFSFPRVLVGSVSANVFANNAEIFVALTTPRPLFGPLLVMNAASHGNESTPQTAVARASMAFATGEALAAVTQQAARQPDKRFPLSVAGTTVSVNGVPAQILFVSPSQVNFVIPTALELGVAEVIVTNADGFQSRSSVSLVQSAPGLFSLNGEGFGEGVVLNADTLEEAPFDPDGGTLRLSVFATGVRNAANVSLSAAGHPLRLESINASPDLPGLDEIHLLVPSSFRGVGTIPVVVRADGRDSNPVDLKFTESDSGAVVINEVLADPPDGLAGDANHDAVRSSSDDEFVELFNAGSATNISGWTIRTGALGGTNEIVRHRFSPGTVLLAGEAVVIFGGGSFNPNDQAFGCASVIETSSAGLSLTNGGLTLILRDDVGALISELTYGGTSGLAGDNNQSLTRSPDITGVFVQHTLAVGTNGRPFSPGLKTGGTPLADCPSPLTSIVLSASTGTLIPNETIYLAARPVDFYGRPLPGASMNFISENPAIASVEAVTADEPPGTFTASITAHHPGVARINASATFGNATISATVTINVVQPSLSPLVVINQLYGGGNNSGATFQNDFVELFNRGVVAVDFAVTPFSLQYASASGAFSNTNKLDLTAGTIAPGQFLLIRLAGGLTNGMALPPADFSSATINLSASDGKVALVLGTGLLSGTGCPLGPTVADFVGYGSASCAEGTAVGSLGATKAARRINRCVDSNVNAADFEVLTNPSPPHNSASPMQPCQ